jgi:hypothetical protein
MTKKDYEAIAGAIRDVWELPSIQNCAVSATAIVVLTLRIMEVCAENNDRFDKRRFISACGMIGEWQYGPF